MSEDMANHYARTIGVELPVERFGDAPSAEPCTDTALAIIRRGARTVRPAVPPTTGTA